MAKDRKVVYTLVVEAGAGNAKTVADVAAQFKELEKNSKAAQKAINEANAAVGKGGRSGGKGGSFGAGFDKAARDEMRRAAAEEKREREAILRDKERDFLREKKINAERIRANVDASRAAREAAKETKSGNYQNRQAAEEKKAAEATKAAAAAKKLADKEAAAAAKQAAIEERRENEANIKATAAAQKQAAKEAAAAQKAAAKEAADFEKQMSRQVGTLGRQYGQRERAGKQADALTTKAWKDAGQAVGAATGAMVSYGRAVVLASAADEESAQRMLQKIAKFEAFASVLTGTISLVKAGTSAWKAYQAAAAAAALAQGAGVAGRAGMGAALGGMARSAGKAGLIGGGIALGAGVGMVGLSALGGIASGKGVGASLSKASGDIWEGIKEFLGISDLAESAAKKAKRAMENARQSMADADALFGVREGGERELLNLGRERAMMGPGSERDKLRAALKGTREEISFKESQISGLGNHVGIGTQQTMADSLVMLRRQELVDVKEIARVEMEAKRAKIDGEKEALGILRNRAQEARRALQDVQNASKDAATRFGGLSDSEQRATLMAARKAASGGSLTREEEERLRNNAGGALATAADESARKRAMKAGFGEIGNLAFNPLLQKAQAQINTLNAKVEARNEITVKMEADYKRTAEATAKAMQPVFDKLTEALVQQMELMVRKLNEEVALRAATGAG